MRSLSDQTVTELGGPLSVLTRQKRDHVKLDRLLDELAATRGAEQERVLHRIARLVFPHAFAEESVLWPELRLCLSDGEALTLQVEQEHQEVNELWTRLESGTLTVVDHLRDAVDAGARRADGPAAQRLTGVSQALRSGGQRIERLPFLRAGEDPSTRRDPAGRSEEGEA